ncbi:MAG: hypothetical protein K6U88_15095 [Dehalococcoidia bacterium]|nr:hypothetical protein [Dehalococcoidia bacterium]
MGWSVLGDVGLAVLIAAVLYAGVPNLLVRVLRLGALWRGPRDPRQKVVALTFDD